MERLTQFSRANSSLALVGNSGALSPPQITRKARKIKSEIEALLKMRHANIEVRTEAVQRSLSSHSLKKFREDTFFSNVIENTSHSDFKKLRKIRILTIFEQVASAVAFLHAKKMYHMNINPDNILLKHAMLTSLHHFKSVTVCLICSNSVSSKARFSYSPPAVAPKNRFSAVSDIDFTSPESIYIGSELQADKHDMWMFGATMYKACTGAIPVDYHAFIEDPSGMPGRLQRFVDVNGIRNEAIDPMTMRTHILRRLEGIFAEDCELHGGLLKKSEFMRGVQARLLHIDPEARLSAEALRSMISFEISRMRVKQKNLVKPK